MSDNISNLLSLSINELLHYSGLVLIGSSLLTGLIMLMSMLMSMSVTRIDVSKRLTRIIYGIKEVMSKLILSLLFVLLMLSLLYFVTSNLGY